MTAQPSLRPAEQPATVLHLLGTLIDFRATGAETGNAYSLVEVTTAPGAGVPPHVQTGDDEAFYVLEGRYGFMHAGRRFEGGPGTFVLVKRGEAHAFHNAGTTAARMLILNSPGGKHEGFFREAGDPVAADAGFPAPSAPDMARLMAAAQRHGIEFLPPEA